MLPILSSQILSAILVFTRVFSMMLFAPVFGHSAVPMKLQVIVSILLTMVLFPVVAALVNVPPQLNMFALVLLVGKEVLLGIVFGFAATVVMSVMRYTGDFIGRLVGFHAGNVVDPFFQDSVGFVGQFYTVLFMLLFLSVNGHLFIIQIIAKSFSIIDIGTASINGPLIQKITELIGNIFVLGVKFATPILSFVLIMTVAFGIMGKAIPEMNLLILMLPAKILVGLVGMIVVFPFMFMLMKQLIASLYRDLELILHLV